MRFILLSITSLALASCGTSKTAAHKPVPPKGSDDSDMPWNVPGAGEGAGALGGLLEGR